MLNKSLSQKPINVAIQTACDRLFHKYDVSRNDTNLSYETLCAFFDAKCRLPGVTFILPQTADWAWHELITDTANYSEFCEDLISSYKHIQAEVDNNRFHHSTIDHMTLSHMTISPENEASSQINAHHTTVSSHCSIEELAAFGKHLTIETELEGADKPLTTPRDIYQRTVQFFNEAYGIDFVAHGWVDAGWDSPKYRLRDQRYSIYQDFQLDSVGRSELEHMYRLIRPEIKVLDTAWIHERLTRRYPISDDGAELAVAVYMAYLNWRLTHPEADCQMPAIASWAAFEHVLWTDKYREACDSAFGNFLDFNASADWINISDAETLFSADTKPTDYGFNTLIPSISKAGWLTL